MNDAERNDLLHLARHSITYFLEHGSKYRPELPKDSSLREHRAVFVTLTKAGSLRGCIGQMQAREPLYEAVAQMAVAAAVDDYRFLPLHKDELESIRIEISVLSPLERVDKWQDIRLGVDGVMVKRGFSHGVFLPQVALETGWDKITFLRQLCEHKAGLPPDAYADEETELYVFQVEHFSES